MSGLYSDKIMDHYKNPRNRGLLDKATVTVDATNPICGDCTNIQLNIDNDTITDAHFDTMGCAISVASASMLMEYSEGKNVEEMKKFSKEDMLKMMGAELTPSKLECGTMAVDALHRAIKSYEEGKNADQEEQK
jgi:nitrogen fixation NifU-like protein